MRRRSLVRLVAALGVAAAVALGTAGPAAAEPTGAEVRTTAAAHAAAPTANLPPGLNVGPIEMSMSFGGQRYTRTYDNRGTTDLLALAPLTGAARQEFWDVTLRERVPGGPYLHAFGSPVDVVPLYTVTTSELYFATAGCDPLNGYADPTTVWVDPAGGQRRVDLDGVTGGYDDQVHLGAFRGTWTGVDLHRGLTAPTVRSDPHPRHPPART